MSIFIRTLFSFTLFFPLSLVFSNDEYSYLVKSMSWKKINRQISSTNLDNENSAFALYRYMEEHSEKDSTRIKLLYFTLTGINTQTISKNEINVLTNISLKDSKIISRIALYKLIKELRKSNLISSEEKYELLLKFPIELDPISIFAFTDSLQLLYDSSDFSMLVKRVESLSEEEKKIILNADSKLILSKAYLKLNRSEESKKTLLSIFFTKEGNSDAKKRAVNYLKEIWGDRFDSYSKSDISNLINFLSLKDQKEIYKFKLLPSSHTVQTPYQFRNVSIYFLNNAIPNLENFLSVNQKQIGRAHV